MTETIDILEPAKTVTEICGGVAELARLAECSYAVALRFGYPKEKNGGGGFIPSARSHIILKNAQAEGIPLSERHFFKPELRTPTDLDPKPPLATTASLPKTSGGGAGGVACDAVISGDGERAA